jgi:DUF4097 and DUF4098 domain-containing protein YvlB
MRFSFGMQPAHVRERPFSVHNQSPMKTVYIFVLLLISINCLSQEYSFKESYQLGSSAQVSVSSSDGNIEAVAFDNDKTDVFYIVKKNNKVLNISRADLEKEVTLEVVQSGNSLSIVVKYKNEFGWTDWRDKMIVSFRLQLPRETACILRTSDGNIALKGLGRDQRCNTSDGNVSVSDVRGAVTAATSDGNVSITKVTGNVEAKTSDGDIHLEEIKGDTRASTSDGNVVATKLMGNITMKTSDGDLKFRDIAGSLNAQTSDGNVSGNVVELKSELTIRTSDGNISVYVPANIGMDLNIKGERLDVPLNNFSGRSDERSIQGKSNGGGVAVNLTTSGNVTLAYR